MRLLLYPPPSETDVAAIHAAAPELEIVVAETEEAALAAAPGADGFYGRITPAILRECRRLRWIQTPMAGLEHYMFPELIAADVVLTNVRGIYSDHIADQVIGYVLCFARGLHHYIRRQTEGVWAAEDPVPIVHLADATLGIVGLGGIGTAVAARAAAHEMRVIAVDAAHRPPPPFVAESWGLERLADLLRLADFVAVCVPQTPETEGLFGPEQFATMKPTAYFINVGRGRVVRLAALVEALRAGRIAGAALDVFEVEPLPAENPLWQMPNVILTPHTAGRSPHTAERRRALVVENVRRFVAGKSLLNVVDKSRYF